MSVLLIWSLVRGLIRNLIRSLIRSFLGSFRLITSIRSRRRLRLNRHQLHFKDQRRSRCDVRTGLPITAGEIRRNEQLPLRSYRHHLQRFGPTLTYAAAWARRRLAAFVRAAHFLAANHRRLVTADYR